MEEIDRLKLRAQVIAQASTIILESSQGQTAAKITELAEILWAWISKPE